MEAKQAIEKHVDQLSAGSAFCISAAHGGVARGPTTVGSRSDGRAGRPGGKMASRGEMFL